MVRRPQARAWASVGNQRSIVAPRTELPVSAATAFAVARDRQSRAEWDHRGVDCDDAPADREAGGRVARQGVAGRAHGDRAAARCRLRRRRATAETVGVGDVSPDRAARRRHRVCGRLELLRLLLHVLRPRPAGR